MRADLKDKIAKVIIRLCGLAGFITQSLQFFTGKWTFEWYVEVLILLLFAGLAYKPSLIIKAFIKKVTNNNQNSMTEELKEEYKEELNDDGLTGGELPDEDEEV